MRLLPCGDRAVLLDCEDLDEARRWHGAVAGADGVDEAVLGASTVLLRGSLPGLRDLVRSTHPRRGPVAPDGDEIEIPVVYDGQDLGEVARLTGLTPAEVVAAHTGRPWTAAFAGFAPGFAYLVDGDPRLEVPRRSSARTRVPTGAVGLAGTFSGVYPRSSPGGWQLIGRTELALWDSSRDPAALLQPGTRVRFVDAS